MLLKVRDPNARKRQPTAKEPLRRIDLDREPCPAVTATGLRGTGRDNYSLEDGGETFHVKHSENKPPYRIPSMREIARVPWNGMTVISTFAGAGGSSLGYRLAGFRVLWANEFVDAAREVYAANCRKGTVIDGRDVRQVDPLEVLKQLGLKPGELDVLDGSPPCASFSTAGKREKYWGAEKAYSDKRQRTDDLFFEYVRFLKAMQPRAFVAENVSGLVKGVAKGYFIEILRAMKACGYKVEARLLDAQWLGVPQQRARIIFVGVREDLGVEPVHPKPLSYRYSVRDALPGLITVGKESYRNKVFSAVGPSPTIMADGGHVEIEARAGAYQGHTVELLTKKGKRSANLPAPTIQTHGRRATQSELTIVGGNYAAKGMRGKRVSADDPLPTVFAGVHGGGPHQFYVEKETDISKQAIGREWDKLNPGESSEKYFNLVRAAAAEPSPTVTASGGQNSGIASVTHPSEKRKFAIAELKRICGFPDDFVLTGTYAQQWERLGRAVPPPMMFAIASAVRGMLSLSAGGRSLPRCPARPDRQTRVASSARSPRQRSETRRRQSVRQSPR